MRVRPRVVRGVKHRIELVLIHQFDQVLPEPLAGGVELFRGGVESRAGRHGGQCAFESASAGRRQLAGGE
jgi:hypothetical protein